jgi:hypothetical protein
LIAILLEPGLIHNLVERAVHNGTVKRKKRLSRIRHGWLGHGSPLAVLGRLFEREKAKRTHGQIFSSTVKEQVQRSPPERGAHFFALPAISSLGVLHGSVTLLLRHATNSLRAQTPIAVTEMSSSGSSPASSKGILKKSASKSKKSGIAWDEPTIAEHDKDRGTRMKIDEPDTPFEHGAACERTAAFAFVFRA